MAVRFTHLSLLERWLYGIVFIALIAGLILSIVSEMRLCTQTCAEIHHWRLFGLSFETIGVIFFTLTLTLLALAFKYQDLSFLAGLLIAGALGAETHLLMVQKYQIGSWCPVCVSIAICVAIAALSLLIIYYKELTFLAKNGSRGEFMKSLWKGIAGVSILLLGFLIAVIGVAKIDPLEAAENDLKEKMLFGDRNSPIEIYVFTDWACPACRELEPELAKMAPAVMQKAKLIFIDDPIHTETLNYSPYNVSFLINQKPHYFKLRKALTDLSKTNRAPSRDVIEKLAKDHEVKYEPLPFADVTLSQKYFKQVVSQFNVRQTPTVIIVNTQSKKGKKLAGNAEITESNVLKAIDSLK